jgi:ribosomal protein L25 (general stress protein Ctc)
MATGATTNKLEVEVRTRTGKGSSRQARREGKVPAVLYGHGSEPQHLNLNARAFAAVMDPTKGPAVREVLERLAAVLDETSEDGVI